MKLNFVFCCCAALALAVPGSPTMAQEIFAKQDQNSVHFQLAWESPYQCDDETAAGFRAWTNVGSKLIYTQHSEFWSGYRQHNSEHTQVTFQPGSTMGYATAVVNWGNSVGGYPIDGKNVPIVDDADIIVNNDRWMSGMLDCADTATPSNQFDLARIIAHEAGHASGLDDTYATSATSCAMYGNSQYGYSGTSLCSNEANQIRRLYGLR